MKLSYILGMLLSASLLAMPAAYAMKGNCADKATCMIEKQNALVADISLDPKQQKLWQNYMRSIEAQKANMIKMKELRETTKNATPPHNAVEAAEKRLHTREKMMVIENDQIKQMKTGVAELKTFYQSLNKQQKKEFDAAFKKMQEKMKSKMEKMKQCKMKCAE